MDKDILDILSHDARITPKKIAGMLGLSEEEVILAVKRLEHDKVIRAYKTVIDWDMAGQEQVFAFIDIRVSPSKDVGFDVVANKIADYPQVHSVHLASGDFDLRVVVSGKSMREVAFFVAEELAPIEGVLSTRTSFLLRKYKEDGDIFDSQPDSRLAITP
jgi:DNA-binding Lrp family transcriptional regulator